MSWTRMMTAAALTAAGIFGAPGCADDGAALTATALVTAPATANMATVRLIGATDWEAAGREQLQLNVLVDGEAAGFELGGDPLVAFEGSGMSFGVPEGSRTLALAHDGEVIWDFGEAALAAGVPTDLVYYGSPDDPHVLALDDLGATLPEGQAAARMLNLDDRHEPVDALLCPRNVEDFDDCEVVGDDIPYGSAWTGVVALADERVLRWERTAPADYPWGRFVGGGGEPIGHSLCQGLEPTIRTLTLIPVHYYSPSEAPDCSYCTSGWMMGDGTTPGDCAW